MISPEEVRATRRVLNSMSLDDIIKSYTDRQNESTKANEEQFDRFLAQLNNRINKLYRSKLPKEVLIPFYKSLEKELMRYVVKKKRDKDVLIAIEFLRRISEPRTKDPDVITSLEFQTKQIIKPDLKELSYEKKHETIFSIVFDNFDINVQNAFLKLSRKYNYDCSSELLTLMCYLLKEGQLTMANSEDIEKDLKKLATVNRVIKISDTSCVAETVYGTIPFSVASVDLGIEDIKELRLGNCHFAVSDFLPLYPNLFGAYYYIPEYFKGFYEHSVLIDYDKGIVYDLSHNLALPLKCFAEYYGNPTFTISSSDFKDLSDMVEDKYGFCLAMHHIEEIRRQNRKRTM